MASSSERVGGVMAQLEEYRKRAAMQHASGESSPSPSDPPSADSSTPGTTGTTSSPSVLSRWRRRLDALSQAHYWPILALKCLLWFLLLLLFAKAEFGSVFVVFSLFCLLFANLRTGSRAPGELSAYSVFNENCQRLPGQMTAEQFENEIRRRNV